MQLQAVAPAAETASDGQAAQASGPAPALVSKRPEAQTHWLALEAPPCSVVWLAPHGTQPAPLADHVPAAHVTQAVKGEMEPAAPAWPAVHAMPVHESCMAPDQVPGGQGAEGAPPGQKLPGAHGSTGSVSTPPTSAQA